LSYSIYRPGDADICEGQIVPSVYIELTSIEFSKIIRRNGCFNVNHIEPQRLGKAPLQVLEQEPVQVLLAIVETNWPAPPREPYCLPWSRQIAFPIRRDLFDVRTDAEMDVENLPRSDHAPVSESRVMSVTLMRSNLLVSDMASALPR